LPELKISGESLMFYMFPFEDLITVEFRHYNPTATGEPNRFSWPLRNYMWAKAGPLFSAQVEANIADREIRYKVIDGFCAMWRFKLENLVRSDNTVATDQIIEYPKLADGSRYTFSLWAFPEEIYPTVLPQYFEFCSDHGGLPLPNQTPLVTRAQVEKGLGDRWKQFGEARKKFDPGNRLLNDYFKELLGVA